MAASSLPLVSSRLEMPASVSPAESDSQSVCCSLRVCSASRRTPILPAAPEPPPAPSPGKSSRVVLCAPASPVKKHAPKSGSTQSQFQPCDLPSTTRTNNLAILVYRRICSPGKSSRVVFCAPAPPAKSYDAKFTPTKHLTPPRHHGLTLPLTHKEHAPKSSG